MMDSSVSNQALPGRTSSPQDEAGEDLSYADYRILVADDQDSIAVLVQRVVAEELGCEVLLAKDGNEVLERMKTEPVDVLVTDMMMPGIHGLELVAKVRASWPETDIVVITGYPSDFPYLDVIRTGASDFLTKPFPQAELEAKLVRIFREQALLRERTLAENKYRLLFEMSTEGMLVLDEETFAIRDANHAFRTLCGLSAELLTDRPVYELFDSMDGARLKQWLNICSRSGGGTMADLNLMDVEGRETHVDISATYIEAEGGRFIFLVMKDVTEKLEVEKQLAEAAQKDELTGLFNKRSFQNRIEWSVLNAKQSGAVLSLLLIDLDNFKRCNDTHGHPVGDQLLRDVGSVIEKSIRLSANDQGFRCGGDEFTVILHGTDENGSVRVAERMRTEFEKIENYGTSMSIGVAVYRDGVASDTFIRWADEALYEAKGQGKNTVRVAGAGDES